MNRLFRSILSNHYTKAIGIGCIVWFVFAILYGSNIFDSWQWKFSDKLYGSYPTSEKIVIIAIDDASIQSIGRWPWDRSVFGEAVDIINEHKPSVIGIDVNFPEPTDEDSLFAESISKAGNVVLPVEVEFAGVSDYHTARSVLVSTPEIYKKALAHGITNVIIDRDGVVRKLPVSAKYNDVIIESFFARIVRLYRGDDLLNIVSDEKGGMLINFAAAPARFRTISFADVLRKQFNPSIFENSIVLIGSTAPDLHDTYVTPLSRGALTTGVEIHAHALNTVLAGKFLREQAPHSVLLVLLCIMICGAFLYMIVRPLYGIVVVVVSIVIYTIISFQLFDNGIIPSILYPVTGLVIVYGVIVIFRFLTEEKEKRRIRKVFMSYVSPPVADEILKSMNSIKLGGDRKKITVLFSDIRGFTSLSEKMNAENLVLILNQYLSRMTDIIFGHEGVVDKYIGDAIMCLWGAPLSDEQQSYRALLTALHMKKALVELNKKWEEEKTISKSLAIGIGINTDEAIVGNVGSLQRFDYTAIGDGVNLASRLEGLNKEYGTYIIFSESTLIELQNIGKDKDLVYRYIDAVKVKGKQNTVRIYELIGEVFDITDDQYKDICSRYADAMSLLDSRKLKEAREVFAFLVEKYNDGPSMTHMTRIDEIISKGLEHEWSGVHEMKKK